MITTKTEEYILKGNIVPIDVYKIANHDIIITGKLLRIAKLKEEWDDDVNDPDNILSVIKKNRINADIFSFQQRLPESRPKFSYYMEWDNVAALPIISYEKWYNYQLHCNHRNKIKLAMKRGLIIKEIELNDETVKGINNIYNETPVRQGRPYWNYGMNIENTKKENATFADRAVFIGAYFKEDLIGYIRLVFADRFARTMGILSMVKYRNMAPNNALFAKAVQICADKKISYLIYAKFDYGKVGSDTLMNFKRYNGFESIILPRYYIPLNLKGKVALKCNLHHGVIGILPKKNVKILRKLRNMWYENRL